MDVVQVDEDLWFGSAGDEREVEARAAESMAATAARVLGAKPFPAAAKRLEELTRDPSVRIEQVVSVLESDPGLSMRLLRLVNSAGYALRARCTSVRHAAALVGMRRLHQLGTTAAILDMFETNSPLVVSLLSHSAVVGAISRYLAIHVNLPPDELFTCGFLHDIGKLMLLDTEGERYEELVRNAAEGPDLLHVLERERFGFDHAVLGAHVLRSWKIPNPVPRVVAWHHSVGRAYQSDPTTVSMVQALRLADQLSYLLRSASDADGVRLAAASDAARFLEISEAQLAVMWADLRRLSLRIAGNGGARAQSELIPREESMPPSIRPRRSRASTLAAPAAGSVVPERDAPLSIVPKHFACVVCRKASYGSRCPICSGGVCPEHQVGPEQWCADCALQFSSGLRSARPPTWARWTTLGIAGGVVLASLGGAALTSEPTVLELVVGPALIGGLCVLVLGVGWRAWLRHRFVHTRGQVEADDVEPEAGSPASVAGDAGPMIPAHAPLPLGMSAVPSPQIFMRSDIPPAYLDSVAPSPSLWSLEVPTEPPQSSLPAAERAPEARIKEPTIEPPAAVAPAPIAAPPVAPAAVAPAPVAPPSELPRAATEVMSAAPLPVPSEPRSVRLEEAMHAATERAQGPEYNTAPAVAPARCRAASFPPPQHACTPGGDRAA